MNEWIFPRGLYGIRRSLCWEQSHHHGASAAPPASLRPSPPPPVPPIQLLVPQKVCGYIKASENSSQAAQSPKKGIFRRSWKGIGPVDSRMVEEPAAQRVLGAGGGEGVQNLQTAGNGLARKEARTPTGGKEGEKEWKTSAATADDDGAASVWSMSTWGFC